ncbi:S8 family serine peptidase [Vibrio splendidus]|uniref:S8 family serine peptidase n=1 Tax=Vibrio splendidus TaxID=29497 RepID=UPI0002F13F87|nr:S8 family serine peptidase [Vibrio splendidus]PTP54703.1 hypothetical protein CWO23_25925 [Vibrio splendidus]
MKFIPKRSNYTISSIIFCSVALLSISKSEATLIDNMDFSKYTKKDVTIIYKVKPNSSQRMMNYSSPEVLDSELMAQSHAIFGDKDSAPSIYAMGARSTYNQAPKHLKGTSLDGYFSLSISADNLDDVQSALKKLRANNSVLEAYIEGDIIPEVKPYYGVSSAAPNMQDKQYYLNGVNKNGRFSGVNAKYAWKKNGGKGQNVDIVSVECGVYNFQHEDLKYPFIIRGNTNYNNGWGDHTTQSVGTMTSIDNGYGVTGIANQSRQGWSDCEYVNIISAANQLNPGSVMQVGVQTSAYIPSLSCSANGCLLPMTYYPLWRDVIKYATSRGIHVIMAAGNGGVNLDAPALSEALSQDTGAIMVGAVNPTTWGGGEAETFSNYGSYINSASWGSWVATTSGRDQNTYTEYFNGTSSANPIVAATVAVLQSIAIENGLGPIEPKIMRQLLKDTGTPINGDRYISTQPNLKRAIDQLLNGDNGDGNNDGSNSGNNGGNNDGNDSIYPDYVAGQVYVGGDIVFYNGKVYKAQWWTTEAPYVGEYSWSSAWIIIE